MRDMEKMQLHCSRTCHHTRVQDLVHKEPLLKREGTVMLREFYTKKSHRISEEKENKTDI